MGGSDQLNGVPVTDYLQYPTVCLDDLFPKRQEVHQAICHRDLFLETVGVSIWEID